MAVAVLDGDHGRARLERWFVLLGCFIGMAVATPAILLQPMALFVKPGTAEFGWSRTQFSTSLSMAALLNALVLPLAGYLVDRFGAPRIVAIGTALGCGSYAALSSAHSYAAFVALVALSTLTGNLASYPAMMGVAQRWFDKRLGTALAVTSTGLAVGVGSFSYLIARTIELRGWRAAFLSAGLTALLIGLVNVEMQDRRFGRSAGRAGVDDQNADIGLSGRPGNRSGDPGRGGTRRGQESGRDRTETGERFDRERAAAGHLQQPRDQRPQLRMNIGRDVERHGLRSYGRERRPGALAPGRRLLRT